MKITDQCKLLEITDLKITVLEIQDDTFNDFRLLYNFKDLKSLTIKSQSLVEIGGLSNFPYLDSLNIEETNFSRISDYDTFIKLDILIKKDVEEIHDYHHQYPNHLILPRHIKYQHIRQERIVPSIKELINKQCYYDIPDEYRHFLKPFGEKYAKCIMCHKENQLHKFWIRSTLLNNFEINLKQELCYECGNINISDQHYNKLLKDLENIVC